MITLRPSHDRGLAEHGWLKSYHSFSFADYDDPKYRQWGNLRVINEDRVQPDKGFGTHSHRDMEIISYVLDGLLAHQDSMGNVKTIPPGDVQRMSAGTGVIHSEFNHAPQITHFLQIWIVPHTKGIKPSYEQKTIPAADKRGKLRLVVSPDGAEDSLVLHADAKMYAGLFTDQEKATLKIDPAHKAYVHLISGALTVNDHTLTAGDALLIEQESSIIIKDGKDAEVLVFELAP